MKITYKFTENELFDFNMFRALRKNSNTIPRAIFVSCGYLAALLVIGYWCKFPWWIYFIFFCRSGTFVFRHPVVYPQPDETFGACFDVPAESRGNHAPDDPHAGR